MLTGKDRVIIMLALINHKNQKEREIIQHRKNSYIGACEVCDMLQEEIEEMKALIKKVQTL